MDKSFVPLLVALAAIVVAGAALAAYGGPSDGGGRPPGSPPQVTDPGYNAAPTNPEDPTGPRESVLRYWFSPSALALSVGETASVALVSSDGPVADLTHHEDVTFYVYLVDESICKVTKTPNSTLEVEALKAGNCEVRAVMNHIDLWFTVNVS